MNPRTDKLNKEKGKSRKVKGNLIETALQACKILSDILQPSLCP
jgi:hypothetical protein